jgi:thiol-disulfide isomerase/thioredoxin
MQAGTEPAPESKWVICLCAQWCGTCRDWRELFDQAATNHPRLRFGWIDVEDEAAAMGDVDVETFPTLLVADGARPLFFGPIPPSLSQFSRLLATLLQDGSAPSGVTAETPALLARLSAVLLSS